MFLHILVLAISIPSNLKKKSTPTFLDNDCVGSPCIQRLSHVLLSSEALHLALKIPCLK